MHNKHGAVILLLHSGQLLRATAGHFSCLIINEKQSWKILGEAALNFRILAKLAPILHTRIYWVQANIMSIGNAWVQLPVVTLAKPRKYTIQAKLR